jgi:DNA-binding SARP family transcriptional activator/DNA-binding XRE family transcriptional regulator
MTDHSGPTFAAILQARRLGAGLTQQGLAELAGLSLASIRDLEQGRRRMPRPLSAKRLAAALRLDETQLCELLGAARHSLDHGSRTGQSAGRPPSWAADDLWLQILGPVTAWCHGHRTSLGPPKQRAVLAFLAAQPGSLVHRETIIDTLWDDPPVSAVNLVQGYVSHLRRTLEPDRSLRDRGGRLLSIGASYQLNVTAAELDLLSFRELAHAAKAAYSRSDFGVACDLLAQALGLWQHEPLGGIDRYRSHPAAASLNRERADAVLRYADCCDEVGQPRRALSVLWSLTASDPLYEPAHARLIIALAHSGDPASAVKVFQDLRHRLDNELGVYPSTEVERAYAQVLRANA